MKENEVLARFMGHEEGYDEHGVWQKLQYNTSWSWLMPVVDKICQHVYNETDETHKATAFLRTFGMRTDEGKWMVRFNRCGLHEADTLIEATFKACVEFIEWYNANKQL